jgi:hypothetical protein
MKWMIAIALLAVAGSLPTKSASAQRPNTAHYQSIQYTVPPVPIMGVCNVNGVDYQVDYNHRIWAVNAYGNWFVIGRIVSNAYGTIAIRNDGTRYPASC